MIEAIAIIWGLIHVIPWAIAAYKEKNAPLDLRLMLVVAGAIMALLIWKMVLMFPPIGLVFIFTAIYSWNTLLVYKDKD